MKYLNGLCLLTSLMLALLVAFGLVAFDTGSSSWDRFTVSVLWIIVAMIYINNILDNKLKTLKEEKDAN